MKEIVTILHHLLINVGQSELFKFIMIVVLIWWTFSLVRSFRWRSF